MTITGKFAGSLLSLVGLAAFSIPTYAAEGGKQPDAQPFQQERSDKTQQGQELINKQPMTSQGAETQVGKQSPNMGADLTGGRDSHLGPHDAQESQMQKKDKKGGGGSSGR